MEDAKNVEKSLKHDRVSCSLCSNDATKYITTYTYDIFFYCDDCKIPESPKYHHSCTSNHGFTAKSAEHARIKCEIRGCKGNAIDWDYRYKGGYMVQKKTYLCKKCMDDGVGKERE